MPLLPRPLGGNHVNREWPWGEAVQLSVGRQPVGGYAPLTVDELVKGKKIIIRKSFIGLSLKGYSKSVQIKKSKHTYIMHSVFYQLVEISNWVD